MFNVTLPWDNKSNKKFGTATGQETKDCPSSAWKTSFSSMQYQSRLAEIRKGSWWWYEFKEGWKEYIDTPRKGVLVQYSQNSLPQIFPQKIYNATVTSARMHHTVVFSVTRYAPFGPATSPTHPHERRCCCSSRIAPLRSPGSSSTFARYFRRCSKTLCVHACPLSSPRRWRSSRALRRKPGLLLEHRVGAQGRQLVCSIVPIGAGRLSPYCNTC